MKLEVKAFQRNNPESCLNGSKSRSDSGRVHPAHLSLKVKEPAGPPIKVSMTTTGEGGRGEFKSLRLYLEYLVVVIINP